jgi:hypothetical protein
MLTFPLFDIVYYSLESGPQQDAESLQHFFAQQRMTNPNAIRGSPNCGQHPQQDVHAVPEHAPKRARLNKNEPYTKQIKSLSPNK